MIFFSSFYHSVYFSRPITLQHHSLSPSNARVCLLSCVSLPSCMTACLSASYLPDCMQAFLQACFPFQSYKQKLTPPTFSPMPGGTTAGQGFHSNFITTLKHQMKSWST